MQQLSKQAIGEFQIIFQEEFGHALSPIDAEELAANTLELFRVVLRPKVDQVSKRLEKVGNHGHTESTTSR